MANAFNDILGFAGKAADTVLLGGAIGKTKRRNQFADFLEQGQFDQAQQLAVRSNEPQYAAYAQQQAALGNRQQETENQIFSGLSIALSEITDPNARRMAFEAMKPGLTQRFGLDDEDFSQVPLDDPNALRLFGQQFIDPKDQRAQALTAQAQAEAARSNRATEGLRGGELGVSRGNLAVAQGGLALDRERLGETRRQFDVTQASKLDGGDQKNEALNTWITARNGLIEALSETETGPIRGRLPAFSADQQTAEGAIAATAPVLKQIFRVAGEGVFTDRDQALLLDMVPKRTDRPEARIAKIRNIDAIINAKLGITQNAQPIPIETPRLTPPDMSTLSDEELEAIANGGR